MKKTIMTFGMILAITACATDPIPPHIQQKVDATPTDKMPRHFIAEREMCNSRRGDEKSSCREQVRKNYYARSLMREEGASK